ncbi:MAG: single-stranded DNA-binding protein, partial [Porticoccaceae bacterium]|nr:single-stranded DNA-binding protein [Porticoccaceae bacterium]
GQDGQDRYTTEIVASEMQMLDSRGGQQSGDYDQSQGSYQQSAPQAQQQSAPQQQQSAPQQSAPQQQGGAFDDDIPF